MATMTKAKTAAKVKAKTTTAIAKGPKKASKRDVVTRRNEYAAKFFPYIEKVARRLARRLPAHVEIDDLISSGVIGLMEAAERFDPNRVDRFEAFAEFRIRGAMLDDLRSRDTLSRDMRRLSNELRDATRRLEAQLGRTPDHEEIAKRLGVGVDELYARQQKLSGSSVVGIDDAGPDLLERTGDQTAADPFEAASRRELLGRLVGGIGDLPEKMQQVLSLYYCDNLNLKEIGTVLGVTESRVCQIHGEATRRLRDTLGELAVEAAA
jgi:RNA polymerase sigma factor FliA